MLLVVLILSPFIFTNPVFPVLTPKIPCVFSVKVTYKKSTKKIPLGNSLGSDQKVYYSILDQYGTDMGITSNKLTVTATNMTRNHALYVDTDASYKNY